jgi:hypothetical protein
VQKLPDALAPLAAYKQFILYKLVPKIDGVLKLPVDYRTLQVFTKDQNWQNNPDSWTDSNTALSLISSCNNEYGIGFFFTDNDPFYFCDIDKCLEQNSWSKTAQDVLKLLPGAAVEVSQSGQGLHIFGTGNIPNHGCKNTQLGLEFYHNSRFVALTGVNTVGSASVDNSESLPLLINTYFPPTIAVSPSNWTNTPVSEWNGIENDDDLINKAILSKSASSKFGGGASFKDLWENNIEILADVYPTEDGVRNYDYSSADAAIAQHLAFYTGNNCERILTLMKQSELVRDKWNRPDYLIRTITRAISLQKTFYNTGGNTPSVLKLKGTDKQKIWASEIINQFNDDRILQLNGPALNAKFWIDNKDETIDSIITKLTTTVSDTQPLGNNSGPELSAGYQYLGPSQQIDHFKGCVYIQDIHKVFTPCGSLLKPDQFNATYGGYIFQLDDGTNDKTTKKAWEAFTESQIIRYPKAESMCFRPLLKSGVIIKEGGRMLVNSYVPIQTPRKKGDITLFLNHLRKLLPNQNDQSILLAYMAACIQYKGVKFQWAPLLQGVESNGKTLFTRCVAYAIGERYTHMPPAAEIGEKYNLWLFNTLFIGVEDIYVPDHRLEIIEILKPMITNVRLACRAMQRDQVMMDVCCNFIFNSNHRNAIRKTAKDTRFAVFFTAQQNIEDLERDGMVGDYFINLYGWLENSDGYAIVADFLENYVIPDEMNPANKKRAPLTSTTDEVIAESLGQVEQQIMEAIDEGRPGFAKGWISSIALDKLLQSMNMAYKISYKKRKELLKSLNYEWHPALNDGRVDNFITFDNGKPRLYIKKGHIYSNLKNPPEIARLYQEDQQSSIISNYQPSNIFNK